MSALPRGWTETTIGSLVEKLQYGYTAKSSPEVDGPRFLRITDIEQGRINWPSVPSCEIEDDALPRYLLADGDIVFARTGSIEKAARVRNPPQAVFASYLIRGRPRLRDLSAWLGAFVSSSSYVEQATKASAGIGRANVNARNLAELRLPIAPLPEQRRIVEAIESYFTRLDDAVATLERAQRNLKRYRASVLKAAVEGRLVPTEAELARAEGRDYEPACVLLERILAKRRRRWEEAELAKMKAKGKTQKDDKWKAKYKEPVAPDTTDLPKLPEGWCWVRAEQCVDSQVGHAFKSRDFSKDGVRLLRGDNIGHGELRWEVDRRKCIDSNALLKHPHLHLAVNDIVLAMDRPLISTGLKIAIVRPTDLPALLVQRVVRLRPALHGEYFLLNPLVAVDRSAPVDELGGDGASGSFRSGWPIGGAGRQIAHPVESGISIFCA